MSVNPNPRKTNLDGRGGGIDDIITKTTGIEATQTQKEAEERRGHYRGLSASSPPFNRTFGGVVTLEKTDLMFVFLGLQTMLLFAIWMEVK